MLIARPTNSVDSPPAPLDEHLNPLAPSQHEVKQNRILASLPDADLWRWLPHLELIDMPLGHVLYETGAAENFVYFPTTVIVSLLYVMENGDSAELAVVGNEGIVGVSLFMGGNTTTSRAVVQNGGKGYRLNAQVRISAMAATDFNLIADSVSLRRRTAFHRDRGHRRGCPSDRANSSVGGYRDRGMEPALSTPAR